jgi:CRISPR system Cascade subunit CasA
MSRYNLIDEPWIPIRFLDGARVELGIRDTLLQSKEIAVIEDQSPLVVAALYRFLLAVSYRALEGPTDIDQAKALFRNGLPAEKITGYLDKWRGRFWLFDEKYPFGQIPTFEPKTWRAWTVLAAEHNADNAKVLFDHVDVETPGTIAEAMAARWMLATQTFSVSAGKSELSHTGTAPSATAVMALPLGGNLRDTLLFCLIPQNRDVMAADLPIWERNPELVDKLKAGTERALSGFCDLYTWRTRSLRLQEDSTGRVGVLAFASGVDFSPTEQPDPMLGYRVDEKRGKLPIQFRKRGLWRDFDSLMPDQAELAPRVIEHAVALTRFLQERFPRSLLVLGQANNKAKIEYWRLERFALPGALVGDRFVRAEIRRLLSDAEAAQKSLWAASRTFGRELLSRGERVPAGADIANFVEQMPSSGWYWSTLEARFHDMLREYTANREYEDIHHRWLIFVRAALYSAWQQHRASVSSGDAWTIRALVKAEAPVLRKLKELDDEITRLAPQKESA